MYRFRLWAQLGQKRMRNELADDYIGVDDYPSATLRTGIANGYSSAALRTGIADGYIGADEYAEGRVKQNE